MDDENTKTKKDKQLSDTIKKTPYDRVVYQLTIKGERKADENTVILTEIMRVENAVDGVAIFSADIAERTVNNIAKTVKENVLDKDEYILQERKRIIKERMRSK